MRRFIRFVFHAPFRGYQDFTLAILPGTPADQIAREAHARAVAGFAKQWTFPSYDRVLMTVNCCDGLPVPFEEQPHDR